MIESPYPLEQSLGMRYYATGVPGIGGRLRSSPADFVVEERSIPPAGSGPHLICRLRKENWEQQRAVKEIARALGISHRRISWAGTKDKRARTTQHIALYNVTPEDIEEIRLKDISLEVVGRSDTPLRLGDLQGNDFTITIRECDPIDLAPRVRATIEEGRPGIPNYYGIQRFGVVRPITHIVGKHLLQNDFEGAVTSYVGLACEDEKPLAAEARREFMAHGDAREALRMYPPQLSYERAMLHSLVEQPGDFQRAIKTVPPKLLSMFVSAYQSYLFNHGLSRRLEEHSLLDDPIPGDRLIFHNGKTDVITEQNLTAARVQVRRGRAAIGLFIPGSEESSCRGPVDEWMRDQLSNSGIDAEGFRHVSDFVGARFRGTIRPVALIPDIHAETGEDWVILRFGLPPGHYATTVCREFMKADPRVMI